MQKTVPVRGVGLSSPIRAVAWEDVDGEISDVLSAKVERLGYLGGFFAALAHAPAAVAAFERFTAATRAALPEPVAETIALTIAALADNSYERVQHERLARAHGHDDAWIAAVLAGPDAVADPLEAAAVRLGTALWHRDAEAARAATAAIAEFAGPSTASAALLLGGRFLAHAAVSAVLDLGDPTTEEDDGGRSDLVH